MSSELQPDVSTQDEFLELYATAEEMTASRFTMTGKASLDELTSTPATIRLRRTVARIDLVVQERGVAVHEVTIRGIADRGYLNERNNVSNPAASESTDFLKEYTDTPLTNSRETLLYLCEQTGDALSVEVIADINGGLHRMTATFPSEILRNRIYTIQVHGNGASASLSVVADNWEEGDSTESAPDLKGVIDVEASALPESVRINSSCDSVYVPYQGAEFRLVLRAEAESDVAIEGIARGVTTQVETLTKSLQPVAAVSVTSDRRLPGEKQAYLYLNLHRDGLCSGRIVLVFEPNPVVITGAITFDENGICDFGKYVDGELGRMKLPEGKTARLAFDSGEDAMDETCRRSGRTAHPRRLETQRSESRRPNPRGTNHHCGCRRIELGKLLSPQAQLGSSGGRDRRYMVVQIQPPGKRQKVRRPDFDSGRSCFGP